MHGDLYFRQGKSTIGKGIEYDNVSSLASYLGEECCRILPGFHALTGSDFTNPFFRRSKNQSFSLMMNLKKSRNRLASLHLLDTLRTDDVNSDDVIEFILRTLYNRPKKEETLEESRRVMMKVGKGNKCKYRSTKLVIPDRSSLLMKIKRSNLVTYPWKNCLNTILKPLIPKHNGWMEVNGELVTEWFEGDPLPSDEEYDKHIDDLMHSAIDDIEEENSEASESEYPLSDEESSSAETDDDEDTEAL